MEPKRYPVKIKATVQYAAKDHYGVWRLYADKPTYNRDEYRWVGELVSEMRGFDLPACKPPDSLMKMVEIDGKQYWEKVKQ